MFTKLLDNMKNITNYNSKGEYHGYQEWYSNSKNILIRSNYKNHKPIGYEEYPYSKRTNFYIR